jgi:hypothetical protein
LTPSWSAGVNSSTRSNGTRADLLGAQVAVGFGSQLDGLGIVDGATDDVAVLELERAVVGVVAADVRVDRLAHRCDVADSRDVPGRDDQPRHRTAHLVAVERRP